MAAALALATPASAQSGDTHFAPGSNCFVATTTDDVLAELAAQPARWNCDPGTWPTTGERVVIRLDQRLADVPADYLVMRRQNFSSLEIQAVASDGRVTAARHGPRDLINGENYQQAVIPVPATESPPVAILLAIDGATYPGRVRDVDTIAGPPFEKVAGISHLFAALLCGLLLSPALFDLGFRRTLRQRFPLYHALFCIMATVNTATLTGLLQIVLAPPPEVVQAIASLSFDLMIAASTLFLLNFIEPEAFDARTRRLARILPVMAVCLGLLTYFGPPYLGAIAVRGYFFGYLVFIAILLTVMWRAWQRGSRAICFVFLSYTPLLLIGLIRIFSTLVGPVQAPFDGMVFQCLALAFEVVVTSFAVADRFMIIKRERDRARSEARVLEELTERDPLTGLFNRRALETRFADLRAQGFTALAAIDLDHFKAVNDRFGHAAGDAALRCVGRALRIDDDKVLAFRVGGEEFVLLLRGEHALARAEMMRLAISAATSAHAEVPVSITASMGVIEAPPEAMAETSFAALYSRADRLLYEAKQSGRDCTFSERLKVFRPRTKTARRVAA